MSTLTTSHLRRLLLRDLKQLALRTGVSTAGAKDVLAARIVEAVASAKRDDEAPGTVPGNDSRPRRILSIDMGIRNFAYCAMEVPSLSSSLLRRKDGRRREKANGTDGERPRLYDWNRVDVLSSDTTVGATSASTRTGVADIDDDSDVDLDTATNTDSATDIGPTSSDDGGHAEPFHPRRIASHAHRLLSQLVFALPRAQQPDTILIERQRFRTGGAAGVQEWTLRVNTLEAMLWAMLYSKQAEGVWTGSVHGVPPARVVKWWEAREAAGPPNAESTRVSEGRRSKKGGEVEEVTGREKITPVRKKRERVVRAARALRDGMVRVDDQMAERCGAFLEEAEGRTLRSRPRPRSRARSRSLSSPSLEAASNDASSSHSGVTVTGKMDDMADCLLQALTWVSWQEQRRVQAQEGEQGIAKVLAQ